MKIFKQILAISVCFFMLVPQCFGAAFTSKAAGLASASGQTTWNEVGVPGDGDNLYITHNVTMDIPIIGHSPDAADVTPAVKLDLETATLTFPEDSTLLCRGDFLHEQGIVAMNPGSVITFDPSLSPSTTSTIYKYQIGSIFGTRGKSHFAIAGSSAKPSQIKTLAGYAPATMPSAWERGDFSMSHIDFTNMGKIDFVPLQGKTRFWEYVRFFDCGQVTIRLDRSPEIDFTYNYIVIEGGTGSYAMDMFIPQATSGALRSMQGCSFESQILIQTDGFDSFNLDNSIFKSINYQPSGAITLDSADNVTFLDQSGSTFGIQNGSGVLVDPLLYFNNDRSAHSEGSIMSRFISLDGGVSESDFNNPEGNSVFGNDTNLASLASTYLKNHLIIPSAGGISSGRLAIFKGTQYTHCTVDSNTIIASNLSGNPTVIPISWGSNSRGWLDQIPSFRNNLLYNLAGAPEADTYGLSGLYGQMAETGTGEAGSTTTVINWTNAFLAQPLGTGYWVIDTATGEKRAVSSTTASSVTVAAFTNAMDGRAFEIFPIDNVTEADYNAFYNFTSDGDIYDGDNNISASDKTGYDGLIFSDPENVGANDITGAAGVLAFVDSDRNLALYPTKELGNAQSTAWADVTPYEINDRLSISVAGFYGGETINFRCIKDHTSSTSNSPGGFIHDWREWWELEGFYEIRMTQTKQFGYNVEATQANYIAWVREGFAPTNQDLNNGFGTYIGAVPVQAAASGGTNFNTSIYYLFFDEDN